ALPPPRPQTQTTRPTSTGAPAVKFGAVPAGSYTVDDDSHITVTVPNTAVSGTDTAPTPAGPPNPPPSPLLPPPPTTTFRPAPGPVGPKLTLNGSNLSSVSAATLAGTPVTI